MTTTEILGLEKDLWDFLFQAFNALVVVIGVPFGLRALSDSVRQQQNASLTKLLEEYRGAQFRDAVRHTIEKVPLFEGSLEERLTRFIDHGGSGLQKPDLESARTVIHKLNDIGAYIDRKGVRERDFFGHTHPRILEMSARLEPLILCVSASNGSRWGMRIRRMGRGASAYYSASRLHASRSFVIDGVTIVPAGRTATGRRIWQWVRRVIFARLSYTPSATAMVRVDEADLATARRVMSNFTPAQLAFLGFAA